jgi:acyl carrier protein
MLAEAESSTPLLGRGIGLDSVESMVLAMALEKEFDISIPDADLTAELFATLGTLTGYVARKLAERTDSASHCARQKQL